MGQRELRTKIYWTSLGLAICLLVFIISVVFLNPTSAGNPSFPWKINLWAVIWALNFIVVLVLGFILARNLIKLYFDYRTNRPGSRLKTKLVFTLSIFSLFPALMMAFLAFGLINRNLQHWFSSPAEQVLSSSQRIATSYYEQRRTLSLVAASWLAERLHQGALDEAKLADWSQRLGFHSVAIIANGKLDYTHAQGPPQHWKQESIAPALEAIKEGRSHYLLNTRINTSQGLVDRGLVAVPMGSRSGDRPAGHPRLLRDPAQCRLSRRPGGRCGQELQRHQRRGHATGGQLRFHPPAHHSGRRLRFCLAGQLHRE